MNSVFGERPDPVSSSATLKQFIRFPHPCQIFHSKKKELASVKQDERQLKHSRKKTPKTEYTQRLCEEKTKVVGPFFEKDNDNSSGIGNILGKTHKKKKPKNESS